MDIYHKNKINSEIYDIEIKIKYQLEHYKTLDEVKKGRFINGYVSDFTDNNNYYNGFLDIEYKSIEKNDKYIYKECFDQYFYDDLQYVIFLYLLKN